tara:strand:- start:56 stop:304 length:249 start_codon:yes stop_codon:yes gene_type:complete
MSNEIIVSKITPQTMSEYTVDWIYGTDTKSVTCSTEVNLSSVSASDRQDASVVATFLKTNLHASVFSDLDTELKENNAPKSE